MDVIRIAICDDEKNIRAYLRTLVRKQDSESEITEYASADEYLSGKMEHDLLFLDIEMKGDTSGMDGMSMAKQLRGMELDRQPVIIFVTGYEKYVYDAFDVDAFQYLLKPINEQKFAEVFSRAAGQILSEAEQKKKTLIIRCGSESRAIPLDSIYYLESRNHKVVLYLKEGELEYYAKIRDLEEELAGQFYRIHRGYLVNLSYVEGYDKSEVTLANGDRLPLSKRYDDFAAAYLQFMQ
ncbi:MAG: response regulator transcription factor [Lachnospiraceae bacterium]|uniref:LytR/AlgR family response regulator transcription factor n=1 Tax=Candidatus Merdisoma sp. JLR.KK006 TaxID=3112626 RepID=UPI002FF25BDA|nr:response regulator transcription factor [Lachnospiraceae bacterium]